MPHRQSTRVQLLLTLLLSLTAVLSPGGRASAQSYDEAVARGVQEFSAGNWEEAYVNFRLAQDMRPGPRPLRGMGMALYEQKRYADSVTALEQALAFEDATHPLTPDARQGAVELLATARAYVATLHVKLTPGDAALTLDGQVVQAGSIYVDSGERMLEAVHGSQRRERRIQARLGETYEIHLDLTGEASDVPAQPVSAAPAATAATASDGSAIGTAPIVAFAVAGAGLATMAVFGVLALGEFDDLEGSCKPGCSDSSVSTLDTYSLVADVGLGVGLVSAAIGVWLWSSESSGDDQADRAGVVPWVTPDGAGLVARGQL